MCGLPASFAGVMCVKISSLIVNLSTNINASNHLVVLLDEPAELDHVVALVRRKGIIEAVHRGHPEGAECTGVEI